MQLCWTPMEIRCYLQRRIDPEVVRVLWALWRLRRLRRMRERPKSRGQQVLDALKEAQARNARYEYMYGAAAPTPTKPRCTCPKSLAAVRQYGKNLFLGHEDGSLQFTLGLMQFTVCGDAWTQLLSTVPVPQTSAAIHIETIAGTVQIMEEKGKHDG